MSARLNLPEPKNYFLGTSSRSPLLADNILLFERRSAADLKSNAQASTPHRRYVLCICLHTDGSVFIGKDRIDLTEGCAALIPPFQFHYYDHVVADSISWLFMTFDTQNTSPLLTAKPAAISLTKALITESNALCELYQSGTTSTQHAHFLIKANSFLYDLLTRSPRQQQAPSETANTALSWPERIQNELSQAPDLTISALATRLGYSEGHLRHTFRQKQNMSLNDYVSHYRLHWAIKRLQDPSASLIDIAQDLGFASQAGFTRFFKRITNTTPARFRRNLAPSAEPPSLSE